MPESGKSPYVAHVFICLNDRQGRRKSCSDGEAAEIRRRLKTACKERGWHNTKIRISQAGCMGLCDQGPNVVIYPQKILFTGATVHDVEPIMQALAHIVSSAD